MQAFVVVRTRFEGVHHWPEAPECVSFLRTPHRHEFHIEIEKDVAHNDRDVEFVALKRAIAAFIDLQFPKERDKARDLGTLSCEQLSEMLMTKFNLRRCVVFEDGENGGGVVR